MQLTKSEKANFETLKLACQGNALALMDCLDRNTGKSVAVICAVNYDGKEYEMVPLARLFKGDPYSELCPPNPDGDPGQYFCTCGVKVYSGAELIHNLDGSLHTCP